MRHAKRANSETTRCGVYVSQVVVLWAEPPRGEIGKILAVVNVTINEEIVIRDFRVIEFAGGIQVRPPSKQRPDGSYIEVAFGTTWKAKDVINDAILTTYEEALQRPECRKENAGTSAETLPRILRESA